MRDDARDAAAALGLGPTQLDQVARNAGLLAAPTARADRIYTGVLYDALGLARSTPRHAGGRPDGW